MRNSCFAPSQGQRGLSWAMDCFPGMCETPALLLPKGSGAVRSCISQGNPKPESLFQGLRIRYLLGGPWDAVTRLINKIATVITLLTKSHAPPSRSRQKGPNHVERSSVVSEFGGFPGFGLQGLGDPNPKPQSVNSKTLNPQTLDCSVAFPRRSQERAAILQGFRVWFRV